jgi:hypothetical protein
VPVKLNEAVWREEVGEDLPPLLDRLARDLRAEGSATANAVAEAYKTLDVIQRTGRHEGGGKIPHGVRHAARDTVQEWQTVEYLFGQGAFTGDAEIMRSLDEAADSLAKASAHEPVGKKALWKHKGWQLPAYIQHIANDLREKRGMDESRAIATAIAAVKRWAAGGGKVDATTKAAAAKAVAEWEKLKAQAKGSKEGKFVGAVSRLRHSVQPLSDQASFSKRYANRVMTCQGIAKGLRESKGSSIPVDSALAFLHGIDPKDTRKLDESARNPEVLIEQMQVELKLNRTLMEALGYSTTPIRARTGDHKGKFHGMHGVEKAVKKRTHIPGGGVVKCADCGSLHVDESPCPNCGSTKITESLLVEAAAPVAASPVWQEGLHPRATHGQFGSKGGQHDTSKQQASPDQGGGAKDTAALAAAIRANDPELAANLAKSATVSLTASGKGAKAAAAAASVANEKIQNIGFANDPGGIAQFQKQYGLPVTGKMDDVTMRTVGVVYANNSRSARSRVPDFTGLAGPGAMVTSRGRQRSAGRKTLGKTSAAHLRNAAEWHEVDDVFVLTEAGVIVATTGVPLWPWPPTGTNHANTGPEGGVETRQPGGDDTDFDEPPALPPNLRERDGVHACKTCVHWSRKAFLGEGGCMLYSFQTDENDLCDDWVTLTPEDATLRVYEAELREAEDVLDTETMTIKRAAIRTIRARRERRESIPLHPADAGLAETLGTNHYDYDPFYIEERDFSGARRKQLAAKGMAMKDESFPIETEGDLENAVKLVGRAKDPAKAKAHIRKRAKALGAEAKLPDSWAA